MLHACDSLDQRQQLRRLLLCHGVNGNGVCAVAGSDGEFGLPESCSVGIQHILALVIFYIFLAHRILQQRVKGAAIGWKRRSKFASRVGELPIGVKRSAKKTPSRLLVATACGHGEAHGDIKGAAVAGYAGQTDINRLIAQLSRVAAYIVKAIERCI